MCKLIAGALSLAAMLVTTPVTASPAFIVVAVALATGSEYPLANNLTRLGSTRPNTAGSAERVLMSRRSSTRLHLDPAHHNRS